MAGASKKTTTIRGRLSYPLFGYDEAVAADQKGMYPAKNIADVKPSFNLLVEDVQLEKVIALLEEFLVDAVARMGNRSVKDRPSSGLQQKEADKIKAILDSRDWSAQPPYIPIKPISDASKDLAPECVASIKIVGTAGHDLELKARIRSEQELLTPDPDLVIPKKGVIIPIGHTIYELYPGCQTMATVHAYSFAQGALPGINLSTGDAVFRNHDTRFGGPPALDEDAMLMDD